MESTPQYPPDFLNPQCPSRQLFGLLASKWSLLVLAAISRGINRNGMLLRELGDISQKMLTQTLRTLEDHQLLSRQVHDVVPPHVEYHLTDLGQSLIPIIQQMGAWVEHHYPDAGIDPSNI